MAIFLWPGKTFVNVFADNTLLGANISIATDRIRSRKDACRLNRLASSQRRNSMSSSSAATWFHFCNFSSNGNTWRANCWHRSAIEMSTLRFTLRTRICCGGLYFDMPYVYVWQLLLARLLEMP
jgi:hypothetical protein